MYIFSFMLIVWCIYVLSADKESDPLYKGNNDVANNEELKKSASGVSQEEGGGKEGQSHARKEKSVLQAKLTKLAIQIGYAGNKL